MSDERGDLIDALTNALWKADQKDLLTVALVLGFDLADLVDFGWVTA